VTFLPGSHILATASTTTTDPASGSDLRLWDVTDPANPREQAAVTGFSNFIQISFSTDGRSMATSQQDDTVTTWDVTDVRQPQALITRTGFTAAVTFVAFSPDGRTMTTGNNDQTLQLWDVSDTSAPRATTALKLSSIAVAVAFSPDGHTLVAGKADDTTELWDVTDLAHPQGPTTLIRPAAGSSGIGSITFSPNNHVLATSGTRLVASNQGVHLWDTDTSHVATRICELAWPIITPNEWNQYLPDIPYQPPCP
jgi:WD40 repeat protein